jgi:hypothetical protein
MDDFSIALALEQGGQAEAAAESALDVSFTPTEPLGAVQNTDKPFPFMGFVLTGVAVGGLFWLIRR